MTSCRFEDVLPFVHRHALLNPAKLRVIWDVMGESEGVEGDAAELGVYRGGVARLMASRWPDRTLHLFDTFTGIPWDGFDAEHDRHRPGEFAASLPEVKAYLARCPNVTFHPGLFPRTASGDRFAFVHLDADLYASTLAGLEWFWPRLSAGGAVVLDDFGWKFCPGVERAVGEFFGDKRDAVLVQRTPFQLVVTKS